MTSTPFESSRSPSDARIVFLVTPIRVGLLLVGLAVAAMPFADLSTLTRSPWPVAGQILAGFLHPDFSAVEDLGYAALFTLSFAFIGLSAGIAGGTVLALLSKFTAVRVIAAILRSIHELIWALLLMSVLGPTVVAGVLAIALAYAGIFGKVYAEILDEADQRASEGLGPKTDAISRFVYGRVAIALPAIFSYSRYRLECAIRSSAVLGFIGLPTLGFQLDSFFKQGAYGAVATVMLVYFAVIASMPFWLRRKLVPVYLLAALVVLVAHPGPPIAGASMWTFFTHDIVPAPLRSAPWADFQTWLQAWSWLLKLLTSQVLPGLIDTLIIGQITLAVTGVLALIAFPISMKCFAGRIGAAVGYGTLVVGRSTPEYMLAYLFLQMFGPSMIPAILALSLHNGAIISHLLGRQADEVVRGLRIDAPRGSNLYSYEILPRLFGPLLALCLYRWEIILRESAILGILGVKTLGFHIDSAISELRLDRAMILILAMALVTLAVDGASRAIRSRLKVPLQPHRCDA